VDVRRLRAGEWLATVAGIGLVFALALPWYEADDGDVSGYEALTVIDILLVLVAAVAFTLAILQATQTSPALPVAFGVLTVVTGAIGTLLTLFRLIDEPAMADVDVGEGAWLSLVAVVALTAGGWLSIKNEHVRHLPPGPEPELRPTPAP
jgi:drug/metabolite transporter (DMT)-like permease